MMHRVKEQGTPATPHDEIVSFLSSQLLKGIGRSTAEKIYSAYGDQALNVLFTTPARLTEIKGIKQKKLEKILASLSANHNLIELTKLLAPLGVTFSQISRIARSLSHDPVKKIRQNPYILCNVRGFSFVSADKVAINMGYNLHSSERIKAGISFCLKEAQTTKGHLFLPEGPLYRQVCSDAVLNHFVDDMGPVQEGEVHPIIQELLDSHALSTICFPGEETDTEHRRIYPVEAYTYETLTAAAVARLLRQESRYTIDRITATVAAAEGRLGVHLDTGQADAIVTSLRSGLSIITGGPGTGKSATRFCVK